MTEQDELMEQTIIKWGRASQEMLCIEECAELIDALMKHKRGRVGEMAVVEELVDVSLMVEQMRRIFDKDGCWFEQIRAQKLVRLKSLLKI